jgi:hypothetical protein
MWTRVSRTAAALSGPPPPGGPAPGTAAAARAYRPPRRSGPIWTRVARAVAAAALSLPLALGGLGPGTPGAASTAAAADPLVRYPGDGSTVWVDAAGRVSKSPYDPGKGNHPLWIPAFACTSAAARCAETVIKSTSSPHPYWTGRWASVTTGSGAFVLHDMGVLIAPDNAGVPSSVRFELGNTLGTAAQADVWAEFSARPVGIATTSAGAPADGRVYTQTVSGVDGAWTSKQYIRPTGAVDAGTDCAQPAGAPRVTTNGTGLITPTVEFTATFSVHTCAYKDPLTGYDYGVEYVDRGRLRAVQLQNVNSGWCLAIDQTANPQGAPGVQAGCTGQLSSVSTLGRDRVFWPAPMGGTQHTLQLAQNGLCLDLPYESTAHGAQVVSGACTWHDSQRWYLAPNGDGTYRILNGNDGLCLDIAYELIDLAAPVVQGTCTGHTSQRWRLLPVG